MFVVIAALALAFTGVALIAASFTGRWLTARWLQVAGIGPFGLRSKSDAAKGGWLRRGAVHASALFCAYLVSVPLFLVAFLSSGDAVPTTRVEVMPGPAMEAGIGDGDRIVRIEEQPIDDWDELRSVVRSRASTPTRVEVERDGKLQTIVVTPNANGVIGVKPIPERRPMGVGAATLRAVVEPTRVIAMTVSGIAGLVSGKEKAQFVGAVGVTREVGSAGERSLTDMLYMLGLLAAYVWPAFVLLEIVIAIVASRIPRAHSAL